LPLGELELASPIDYLIFAAQRLGLSLPKQLSLATFAEYAVHLGQKLTVAEVPAEEVGRQAAAMLLKRIAKPCLQCPALALPVAPIVGNSTVPPG